MKLYMEITTDEYELPVAVADTPTDLARLLNVTRSSVWQCLHRNKGIKKSKYIEVEIEEDENERPYK